MVLRLLMTFFVLALVSAVVAPARAQDVHVYQEPAHERRIYVADPAATATVREVEVHEHRHVSLVRDAPAETGSVLVYSLQGFFAGALVGLSVGYLVTSNSHVESAWRSTVLASGIGALSAAGLGLGLGLLDATSERRPLRFVMRDALYGTLLGAAFGACVGGLAALGSHDGRDALVGASIGGISGFALGGLTGVLEGQLRTRSVAIGLGTTLDARAKQLPLASLHGRF
jgi:hypothetical protein